VGGGARSGSGAAFAWGKAPLARGRCVRVGRRKGGGKAGAWRANRSGPAWANRRVPGARVSPVALTRAGSGRSAEQCKVRGEAERVAVSAPLPQPQGCRRPGGGAGLCLSASLSFFLPEPVGCCRVSQSLHGPGSPRGVRWLIGRALSGSRAGPASPWSAGTGTGPLLGLPRSRPLGRAPSALRARAGAAGRSPAAAAVAQGHFAESLRL